MKLYPLTDEEANFLSRLMEKFGSQLSELQAGGNGKVQTENVVLEKISSVIKSGGLDVYVGSVTDQEGDSSWELTSNLRKIQSWARDMASVSFEVPKTYRVSVIRFGFGAAEEL
jgi:hypothetical protein